MMSTADQSNPLLVTSGFPRFADITPEHVKPAAEYIASKCDELLAKAESAPPGDWRALMDPMQEIDLLMEYGWSPVGHLLSVRNSDALREAHEKVLPKMVALSLKIRQSRKLYERYIALRESADSSAHSSAQKRIIDECIRSAEQSGIALEGESRSRFNEIEERLSRLATDFSNHLLDATKAWSLELTDTADIEGLPTSLLRMASAAWNAAQENSDSDSDTAKPALKQSAPESGPWRFTLEAPIVDAFLKHCRRRNLREQLYRAYTTRASEGENNNEPLITEILRLRRERCALLGFSSHAELSLSRKMAGTVSAATAMLEQLLDSCRIRGEAELNELREYASLKGEPKELMHWDIAFWSERLREERFEFTDEDLRPYFSLDRVLDGLFSLCRRLFRIEVRAADGKAPVWHPDVRFFEVFDDNGQHIAGFYLDPYVRSADKRGGAWMNDCIARCRLYDAEADADGTLRRPVAHLICNGTPPTEFTPSLMTFREVETLFHEFGHGLQHMLTQVDYRDASGINGIEWDAVELPSQFMENWCYHRETLLGMAVHHETGKRLPDELFNRICRARTFRAASQFLRQLEFGLTDLMLHSDFDPDGDESAFDVHRRIAMKTAPLPPLPESRFLCSFQHIFAGGYAAGYYSYKWAEVLSADAFAAFEEAGLDNPDRLADTGIRFRDTVLAQGGSRHPMDVYRDFRGREPDPQALLRHNGLL